MKTTLTEAEQLLTEWKDSILAVESQLDELNRIVMGAPESALNTAVNRLVNAYTEAVSNLVGDMEDDWLSYYHYECDMGDDPREVTFANGETLMVASIADILDVINTDEEGNKL